MLSESSHHRCPTAVIGSGPGHGLRGSYSTPGAIARGTKRNNVTSMSMQNGFSKRTFRNRKGVCAQAL
eukprot:5747824-Amphidinium_carterae.1